MSIEEQPVPDKKQVTDYTCGVSCVKSILNRSGLDVSEEDLAKELGTTEQYGTTPAAIEKVLKNWGVRYKCRNGLSLDLLSTYLSMGPVICLIQDPLTPSGKNGHWVIVENKDQTSVTYMDPWKGRSITISQEEFDTRWFDRDTTGTGIYSRLGIYRN